MPIPHFVVLGGFLGAGKTSAIRRLGESLTNQGIRVGVITNDQGTGLVDTQLLRGCGLATREVAGGCFCCRFDQLMDAARYLTSEVGPEVLVAEAVGSCTDLAATVIYPMRRLFGDRFTIAPLSVMVDPIRARRVMGLERGERFSEDVEYIYRKQLEEADVIVMNKCDLLPDESINELGIALSDAYPRADVMAVSTRDGLQLEDWFHRMLYSVQVPRTVADVDYDVYARGEARLGWVNASIAVSARQPFAGSVLLRELCRELQRQLRTVGAGVAHLKMSLAPNADGAAPTASIHLVHGELEPTPGLDLPELMREGHVVVNLRAESPPAALESALRATADRIRGRDGTLLLAIGNVEAFSPGRPIPTHRDSEVLS